MVNQYNNFTNSGMFNYYGSSSNPSAIIDARVNSTGITSFRYPPDTSKYQFYLVEYEPKRIPNVNLDFTSIEAFQNSLLNNVDPTIKRIVETAISGISDSSLSYFERLRNAFSNSTELVRRISEIIATLNAQKVYNLPIPTPLTDMFKVQYDTDYGYLDKAVGGGPQGLSAVTGITVNTFKTVTMNSPQYRTFSFKWKFSPKTYDESVTVQKILTNIRKGMTPKIGNTNKFLLHFPKIYGLYFYPNVKFLYKFKPCVITGMGVDYSGGNEFPGFFRVQNTLPTNQRTGIADDFVGVNPQDSPPESIALQLQFLELEYWLDSLDGTDAISDYKFGADGLPTSNPFDGWNFYKSDLG